RRTDSRCARRQASAARRQSRGMAGLCEALRARIRICAEIGHHLREKVFMTAEPADRFYESQGLRLHYVDWGNETAPPLILVHGGLDHCRNWDAIARELQPHFHIMALDLRGHGDSEWAKGSSYSLIDNVYDLTRLMRFAALQDAAAAAAGQSSDPPRCSEGRRRPLSLEVRSLSAGEGAVSAVIGRLHRVVVAHYLPDAVDVGRRKFSARP